MRAFGAEVNDNTVPANGRSMAWELAVFAEPDRVIDCGNSGTGVRLIMGAMAHRPGSRPVSRAMQVWSKRPMGRVTDPLALFGAQSVGREGGRLPMTVVGAAKPRVRCATALAHGRLRR